MTNSVSILFDLVRRSTIRAALPVRPRLNQYRSNRREAMQLFMHDLERALTDVMPNKPL